MIFELKETFKTDKKPKNYLKKPDHETTENHKTSYAQRSAFAG